MKFMERMISFQIGVVILIDLFVFSCLELEALESCYWLKATGFAYYVKMYEGKCIYFTKVF